MNSARSEMPRTRRIALLAGAGVREIAAAAEADRLTAHFESNRAELTDTLGGDPSRLVWIEAPIRVVAHPYAGRSDAMQVEVWSVLMVGNPERPGTVDALFRTHVIELAWERAIGGWSRASSVRVRHRRSHRADCLRRCPSSRPWPTGRRRLLLPVDDAQPARWRGGTPVQRRGCDRIRNVGRSGRRQRLEAAAPIDQRISACILGVPTDTSRVST